MNWKINGGHRQDGEPSPDNPVEIKTVNNSVEIDVVDKNYFDNTLKNYGHYGLIAITIPTGVRVVANRDLTTSDNYFAVYAAINLSNYVGKTVRMKATFKSSSSLKGRYIIGLCDSEATNRTSKSSTFTSGETISFVVPDDLVTEQEYLGIWFYGNAGGSGVVGDYIDYTNIIITIDDEDLSYVPHQSQTAIMPIQQEMLYGDYIADVEHHEWGKYIFTGEEKWEDRPNFNQCDRFVLNTTLVKKNSKGLCNYLKVTNDSSVKDVGYFILNDGGQFIFNFKEKGTLSLTEFKQYLKSLYDAKTPIMLYYKLVTPINLELTEAQKAIRAQKLYTYKNITNVNLDNELASIEIEYKKDLETEHNKFQNEIDEIKQLLSTTQTSALLLDSMQNDIESEVE